MTIYQIKSAIEENYPYFFTPKTLKFFGQRMRDFKVYKLDSERVEIVAPIRIRGQVRMNDRRIFNLVKKDFERS